MYTIGIHYEEEMSLPRIKTHEEYVRELKEKGIQAEPLEPYINARTKIRHRWSCSHVTEIRPHDILCGKGCGWCAKENFVNVGAQAYEKQRLKASKEIDQLVMEVHGTRVRRDPKTPYVNNYTKLSWICNKGHQWESRPDHIKRGSGCPKCANILSKGETLTKEVLNKYGIEFQTQKEFSDLKRIKSLSYDFYIPSVNMLIECQGEQHYKPIDYFGGVEKFSIQQERDQLKREYARQNGYLLLEISYKDYRKNRILEILKEAGIIPDLKLA